MTHESTKRLVYVLNQYSPREASHFHHVLHLLEVMAEQESVQVSLVIEKADAAPPLTTGAICVHVQKKSNPAARLVELISILRRLIAEGHDQIFVRISTFGALCAIAAAVGTKARVHYWNSGTTIEHDRAQPWSREKFRWYLKSRLPFLLTKSLVDKFVTGPESMANYYVSAGRVDPNKICILYNDIDLKRFCPPSAVHRSSLRARWGVGDDEHMVLFVHRLSPVKRTLFYLPYVLDRLFDRSDIAAATRVLIVGGGADEEPLARALAGRPYSSRVTMLGRIPNREIHELYQAADVFMNPTYEEGFPRVLLEAMASGLPVVTTDAGGIADILGPQQKAFMVGKDDRDEFGARLIRLLGSKEAQAALQRENLDQVQRFSTERVARMYSTALFS